MPIPEVLAKRNQAEVDKAKAAGLCGERYRRTMSEAPFSRVCTKAPHEGRRHSDAEPKEKSGFEGTCQICFRGQQTRDGLLVLHGYQRPGHGYVVGKCWGVAYAPFEVSCERTKEFIEKCLKPTLADWQQELARLQVQPAELGYKARTYVGYENTPGVRGHNKAGYLNHVIKVAKGSPEGYVLVEGMKGKKGASYHGYAVVEAFKARYGREPSGEDILAHHPAYDRILALNIADCEGRIRMVKADIASYQKKVTAWAPVPWPAVKAVA